MMNDLEQGSTSEADSNALGYDYSSEESQLDSEASACAKIWGVYIFEAEKYDKTLVESWRGKMEGMLIFAGLYSATLTAFIIESYKTLTPDSGDKTAALLNQISKQIAASASGTTFDVPTPTVFVAPLSSIVCNVLWFASLGCSLGCALVATLVEQWARAFIQKADMRPSPVIRARIFSYLYYGLKRFNMHLVVEVVPLLLHMSLVLFFAGLVAFLLPVHPAVMGVSAAMLGIIVVLYCSLTILPLVYFDCPYRTPLSSVLWRLRQFWRSTASNLHAVWFGTQKQSGDRTPEAMVEGMIRRAVQPSAERDDRDIRALSWTVKSLVDTTELEPFIDGIPNMLWGPNGRRLKHDHLIRTLVDDPSVRLGDRLLELIRYSDSGLLTPHTQLQYRMSCLKALWAMGLLSQRGAPLNLPSQDLQLEVRNWMTRLSTSSVSDGVSAYLPATEASLNWSLICGFEVLWETLESETQACEATSSTWTTATLSTHCEPVRTLLGRMGQYDPEFLVPHAFGHRPFDRRAAQRLFDVKPSTPSHASSWLADVRSLLDTRGTYWTDARHMILTHFLMAALNQPREGLSTIFEFQSMLSDMCLVSLPPPSAHSLSTYSFLLDFIPNIHRNSEADGPLLGCNYNAQTVAVILSMFFPVTGPRPSGSIADAAVRSYLRFAVDSPTSETAVFNFRPCNVSHLWDAIARYLGSGCPGSVNTLATLEVMCRVNIWFCHSQQCHRDRSKNTLKLELSVFDSIPPCPPLTSILASIKTQALIAFWFYQRRTLTNQRFAPTQTDWGTWKSVFSHPLFSEVSPTDAELDFEPGPWKSPEEKVVHMFHLIHSRLHDPLDIVYVTFLEACSDPVPPYYAPETLGHMVLLSATSDYLTGSTRPSVQSQRRFANSISALKKVRDTTSEHGRIWKHVVPKLLWLPFRQLTDQVAMSTLKDAFAGVKLDDPLEQSEMEAWLRELDETMVSVAAEDE
ncbi:hypothetical protein C8R46DRAFT_1064509 [Mycena filopes]|nr:hypothetical protein C8R46DRAFT_1064509 [Mycena filopes]